MRISRGFKHVVRRVLPGAVVAAVVGLAAPAVWACDCAFCGGGSGSARGVIAYNKKMHGVALRAAELEAAVEAGRPEPVREAVHRLVRRWLGLHAAFYSSPPAAGADPERWRETLTAANTLLGEAFRKARGGEVEAVRERLPRLRQHWQELDDLLEVPAAYAELRRLRAGYRAYMEGEERRGDGPRWAALRDRLERVRPAWERLAEKEQPELFERPMEPVLERLEGVLEASAEERGALIRAETGRLDQRLEELDARIGHRLEASSGTAVGER